MNFGYGLENVIKVLLAKQIFNYMYKEFGTYVHNIHSPYPIRIPCVVGIRNYEYHGDTISRSETNICRSWKHFIPPPFAGYLSSNGIYHEDIKRCISIRPPEYSFYNNGNCHVLSRWKAQTFSTLFTSTATPRLALIANPEEGPRIGFL